MQHGPTIWFDEWPRAALRTSAIAIFDKTGRSHGLLPEFLAHVPPDLPCGTIPSIFDCLPDMNAAAWAEIWQELARGRSLALHARTHRDATRAGSCAFVVHRFETPDGFLAALEPMAGEGSAQRRPLQNLQHETLEAVALGTPLAQVMELLCRRAEALAPDVACSVLAVDAGKCLRPLAAPGLPDDYSALLDGVPVGPRAGSCGTAAFRGEAVIVTDIATDPLWADYRSLPLPPQLKACWSSPIKGRSGQVIGTFAFYYSTPRGPNPLEREIVATCVHLCAIAIEHDEAQSRIQELAFQDALTGLPNRSHFQKRAVQIMQGMAMHSERVAIHYVDLDDFKDVNDTFGHFVGDLLLKAVAERFKLCRGPGEFIARLGGDEFAIIQHPAGSEAEIAGLARRILACFAEPFEVEQRRITIGASIGVAQAPSNAATLDDLLICSDLALYHAKNEGSCRHCLYTPQLHDEILARRQIENDLRGAIANGEFVVYYQPIVDLATQAVTAFEALVRWRHPKRGLIAPAEFISIAEEAGLICPLGNLVLAAACHEAAGWPRDIKVAVNLSPTQLKNPSFALDVARILGESGLAAERLELEITESVPLATDTHMRHTLTALKTLGVAICLDDFGTGYASLSYLQSFPFDKIKIDLSFVREIGVSAHADAIAQAITRLARTLGLRTTAEGVETDFQRSWLITEGCSEAQGYFFGRPMPPAEARGLAAQSAGSTLAASA